MATVMEAKVFHVQPSHLLGRNAAGEVVFFANKGEIRDAKVGDTIFFNPEKPSMVSRGGVKWFGKNATLEEFAPEPEKPEPKLKPMPQVNARHFDRKGNILFGPRPADLDAQSRAIRNATAQTR